MTPEETDLSMAAADEPRASFSPRQALVRFWRETFVEPLRPIDEEARRTAALAPGIDFKTVVVLVTVAVTLTIQNYLGRTSEIARTVWLLESVGQHETAAALKHALFDHPNAQLHRLTYWAMGCFMTYVVIPAAVIWLVLRERLRDYGVKPRGALAGFWIYLVMFGVVGPLVWVVSTFEEFQETYPFYRLAPGQPLWPNFWWWELIYAVQFVSLEFFFRGFVVHGTRHRFGTHAVFVMTIPYCMIHFLKPMPEAFASIIAGIALGFMSLKTRSIWMGAALHVSVALSMDFASLWRRGYFS